MSPVQGRGRCNVLENPKLYIINSLIVVSEHKQFVDSNCLELLNLFPVYTADKAMLCSKDYCCTF